LCNALGNLLNYDWDLFVASDIAVGIKKKHNDLVVIDDTKRLNYLLQASTVVGLLWLSDR